LIAGDSVAHGAGDASGRGIGGFVAGIAHVQVVNLGINGARTANVLRDFSRPSSLAALRVADVVIVSIGGNDLFGDPLARLFSTSAPGMAIRRGSARVARVIARIQRENPRAKIYLLGLYNPYRGSTIEVWVDEQVARWDARLIADFARTPAVTVIRIADLLEQPRMISADRFHPSADGYQAIAERIVAGW
jgi:lysophospholipase L1-like esterase